MKDFCAIVSGGTFSPLDEIENAAFVIACDKGYAYAAQGGIVPDLFVGDCDSYTGSLPEAIPSLELPKEKDDTDTMAAIRYAVQHGYREIVLYCALGGRLDHLLGNIQAAAFAVKHGARVKITDQNNTLYLMQNAEITFPKRPGFSLSMLSVTDTCTQVTIRGAKYPLQDATISNAFPIGVSNEWESDSVEICVGSGILMLIFSKMDHEA